MFYTTFFVELCDIFSKEKGSYRNDNYLILLDFIQLILFLIPFSKWGEFFGSATLANAVLDRLLHHSTVISIKGPSYRLKDKKLLFESNSKEG